jgi:hypothetical protein
MDPAVGQALEEVRDALRAERNSQEPLSSENAELRARADRLQAERDELRSELEHLRQGRPRHVPRLPEELKAPFDVRPPVTLRRRVRDALPLMMILTLPLAVVWSKKVTWVALVLFAAVMIAAQVLTLWIRRPRWRFMEAWIEAHEPDVPGGQVRYKDMLKVEAYSSKGQRLRGVGSVGVTYRAVTGEEKLLTLKGVPEPERLAEWLQSKRSGRA